MEFKNKLTCIYCEKEYLKEDLSKSDIIPFAFLAGEKLTLKSKVYKTYNKLVNKNAEQTIDVNIIIKRIC